MTVLYGNAKPEKLVIALTGNVAPIPMGVLTVDPRKIGLGKIQAGVPLEFGITMENTGDAPMVVTRLVSKKFKTVYFDAARSGEIVIAPGERRTVDVRITAEKPGRYLDYILVHSNARNVTPKGYKVVVVASASES